MTDFEKACSYFFEPVISLPENLIEKYISSSTAFRNNISQIRNVIKNITDFKSNDIETSLRNAAAELNIKAKEILIPLRVVLSGQDVTPGIFDVMELMGKELVMKRD